MQRLQQINLAKFKKEDLLTIWGCEKCGKLKPFYKSGNDLIDGIYLCWAHDHKYCSKCEKKMIPENNYSTSRINMLLKFYEGIEIDEDGT